MSETQGKSLGARMMALFVAMIISVLAIGMVNTHPTYARARRSKVNGCMRMNKWQLAAYQHNARRRMDSCKNHNSTKFKKASKAYARAGIVRDVRWRAGCR